MRIIQTAWTWGDDGGEVGIRKPEGYEFPHPYAVRRPDGAGWDIRMALSRTSKCANEEVLAGPFPDEGSAVAALMVMLSEV